MADRHEWERPGAFEVLPGVHRIPLPLPGDNLKAVNVYAIADGDRVVLIDGGWAMADSAQLLADSLALVGHGLGDVREFLVTHLHRDHYTQAIALRRAYGGTVSVGEGEKTALDIFHTTTGRPEVSRLHEAGALALAREVAEQPFVRDFTDWEYPDRWLADAVDLPLQTRTLRVIATPGHTTGHVVFHDPEHDALFAGDHVLPHITPSIGVEMNRPPSPLRDYLASLQLVRQLPDARLLPAHGPATGSVHERVDELLSHHDQRLKATADTVDAGASTGYECATALTWTRRERRLADLDLFNQILAVQETMAHLQVLVERGWLTRSVLDGVARFTRS